MNEKSPVSDKIVSSCHKQSAKPPGNLQRKNAYELLKQNPKIKYSQMEDNLGVDESSIWRSISWLKENGL